MAIAGGAIIPPLYGRMVDAYKNEYIGNQMNETVALAKASAESYWILIPCYVFILFFAIWGHKFKRWSS